jgi:hypothetical protein
MMFKLLRDRREGKGKKQLPITIFFLQIKYKHKNIFKNFWGRRSVLCGFLFYARGWLGISLKL